MLYILKEDTVLNYLADLDFERIGFFPDDEPDEDYEMQLVSVEVSNMRKKDYLGLNVFALINFATDFGVETYQRAVNIPIRYTKPLSGRDGVPSDVIDDIQKGLCEFTDTEIELVNKKGYTVTIYTESK